MTVNQIGGQRRQLIVLTLCPPVLECQVSALDVTGFSQAPTECGGDSHALIERREVEKPNHWHGWLLRACHKRPHD